MTRGGSDGLPIERYDKNDVVSYECEMRATLYPTEAEAIEREDIEEEREHQH